MEINEGMFVRTEKGIAKYLGLGKDVLIDDKSNNFKHYANQHLFDNYIFEVGHDWGDTLSDEEFKNIDKYIEKEPSFNLIDLIKVGDYVNGYKVTYIDNDNQILRVDGFSWGTNIIENKDIKTIVTHEQFNSMKYEVGE